MFDYQEARVPTNIRALKMDLTKLGFNPAEMGTEHMNRGMGGGPGSNKIGDVIVGQRIMVGEQIRILAASITS